MAELAELRSAHAAGLAKEVLGGGNAGEENAEPVMELDGECIAFESDRSPLAGVTDEKLAQVIGILEGELQLPYVQEQLRRKDAKAAGKPVEVRARAAHDRFKRAQKKVEKAETAASLAAVELAKAEEKAAAAKEAAAEAIKEAQKAKLEYEKFDVEVAVQAHADMQSITISHDEAELICGTFLVVDQSAVLAACSGNEAAAQAVAARASELQAKLRAGKAAGGILASAGSGKRASSVPGRGHRPAGTHEAIEEMLREARASRTENAEAELDQGPAKGRGRGPRGGSPYEDASAPRSRSREQH